MLIDYVEDPERRRLLARLGDVALGVGGLAAISAFTACSQGHWLPATPDRLPRWRGFNLLEKYTQAHDQPFRQADFDLIAEWGFNFVRLPLDYRIWTRPDGTFRERPLRHIDEAINWARHRNIHVTLCLHRAPGYCVNPPAEGGDLWAPGPENDVVRLRFARQWGMLAERYRDIDSRILSFNLINEPPNVSGESYVRAVSGAVAAIRAADRDRIIIADGTQFGRRPVPELKPLGLAQGTRGYEPFHLSHYKAGWVKGSDSWDAPTWPMPPAPTGGPDQVTDPASFRRICIQPWQELAAGGVGVVVGEWGAYRHTPHPVVLAWARDCLAAWRQVGWGWCLWNFRGDFGVLDSQRQDVRYENYRGHQLDRAFLEILREDGALDATPA
ncbi:glycoside hydrolase family 5 protein [Nitrospirillum pindoramense]|uniref:Endoglucanase n=1 Tax=Nitrospirillum amazonense TaxID=28077 RepID=A0A560HAE5_9PROT|nr:cellulase family glycosylhydrolase [Nitrospirillum amazonense]TWB43323.1 endoglucanase [Nitrospirillum amazonense]